MRKSTIWLSVVCALVIILAVLIILNIQHPAWVMGLLFWQPSSQREITWLYGIDLGNTHRITLIPEEEENPSAAQMQATLAVIKSRAQSLSPTAPIVQLLDDNTIIVQTPSSQALAVLTKTLQAPGLIEFINAGSDYPPSMTVETTLDSPDAEIVVTEAFTSTEAPTVYETFMTNADLEYITLQPASYSGYYEYSVKFKLAPSGDIALLDYNLNHPGELICIVLDKQVITCSYSSNLMKTDSGGNAEFATVVTERDAQATTALLRSGMLPMQLQVAEVESTGPTLGKETVYQMGIASMIALAAALAFLLVHYRLPGLLAILTLLVFALLSLALCKILPLPITLPAVIGLVATGLTTLGALLSIAERLLNRVRAGQTLPRAAEASLSAAWTSIRNTHLALGLLAIATWIVAAIIGAQTIRWLGVSLATGTLASLFATAVFGHTLIRLIVGIDAVQAWLSEQKWPLGI